MDTWLGKLFNIDNFESSNVELSLEIEYYKIIACLFKYSKYFINSSF